jgi:hypothetical protein
MKVTEDELVGVLDALDVPFLLGGMQDEIARQITPDALMEGLAQSSAARVRSAIIPFLLRHPESADAAKIATARLQGAPRETLELFYTAALLLQKKYRERLVRLLGAQPILPDLFSRALQVELTSDLQESLTRLGKRNAELSGLDINWVGGYEHAALTWLEYMELRADRRKRKKWQTA